MSYLCLSHYLYVFLSIFPHIKYFGKIKFDFQKIREQIWKGWRRRENSEKRQQERMKQVENLRVLQISLQSHCLSHSVNKTWAMTIIIIANILKFPQRTLAFCQFTEAECLELSFSELMSSQKERPMLHSFLDCHIVSFFKLQKVFKIQDYQGEVFSISVDYQKLYIKLLII